MSGAHRDYLQGARYGEIGDVGNHRGSRNVHQRARMGVELRVGAIEGSGYGLFVHQNVTIAEVCKGVLRDAKTLLNHVQE